MSIAKAVLRENDQKEAIIKQVLRELNDECTNLCKKTITSPFCAIPTDELANFKWKDMVTCHHQGSACWGISARSSAMEPNDGRKSLLLNAIELSRLIY